jgi:predicted DNA-binding transcriptional regulator YafY
VFDPYAVGVWRNRWYVVGCEHGTDGLRLFRLDRIEDRDGAPVRDAGGAEPFVVPDDFDAPSALRLDPNDWGTDPPLDARIRVENDRLPAFQAELGGRVIEQHDDNAVVEVAVRHRASFRVRLIAFEDAARLLDPSELVDDLTTWLRAVASSERTR